MVVAAGGEERERGGGEMEAKIAKGLALGMWGAALLHAVCGGGAPNPAQAALLGLVSFWAILAAMREGRGEK